MSHLFYYAVIQKDTTVLEVLKLMMVFVPRKYKKVMHFKSRFKAIICILFEMLEMLLTDIGIVVLLLL